MFWVATRGLCLSASAGRRRPSRELKCRRLSGWRSWLLAAWAVLRPRPQFRTLNLRLFDLLACPAKSGSAAV